MRISGNLIDLHNRQIYMAEVEIVRGIITRIVRTGVEEKGRAYLMPGFVDAHVHIESSMLVPSEFARIAVRHGTVATVSDPHEIANVLGTRGVDYMLENAKTVPFKFFFGAPSCVPATTFETAGDVIGPEGVRQLLARNDIYYLAEMMNYPGVLYGDAEVHEKLRIARESGKPIDGHAPGLGGEDAVRYIREGISTDHECVSYDEAKWKLEHGMHILIREGSAAKNFDALIPLMHAFPTKLMFCSDDKHPDDLLEGHIDQLVRRAIGAGYEMFDVLRAACLNPIAHYRLPVGMLRAGDPADFIVIDSPSAFQVLECWISGEKVAERGNTLFTAEAPGTPNRFEVGPKSVGDFVLPAKDEPTCRIIEAIDGSLLTGELEARMTPVDGNLVPDIGRDILKLAVVNRYREAPVSTALIRGFGLKKGAIASSVGHDSHNILAVGTSDGALAKVVNAVISMKGGIAAAGERDLFRLPLPVAGIMSDQDGETVGHAYSEIDALAREELGSTLKAPFMTLSFMALLVIPKLKLSDKGLFDGEQFTFVGLEK